MEHREEGFTVNGKGARMEFAGRRHRERTLKGGDAVQADTMRCEVVDNGRRVSSISTSLAEGISDQSRADGGPGDVYEGSKVSETVKTAEWV